MTNRHPCIECRGRGSHRRDCYSFFTEPPYAKIQDGLYLGWYGARSDQKWGAVVTIATVAQAKEIQNSRQCSGRYTGMLRDGVPVHQIQHEDRTPGVTAHFEAGFNFVEEQLAAGRTVYAHCHAAISRSPLFVALFLADRKGWDFDEAHHFVRAQRPVVDIWKPFIPEGREFLRFHKAKREGLLPTSAIYVPPMRADGWL